MIYVLKVRIGKEFDVRCQLRRKGIPANVPRERIIIRKNGLWSKMIKNLFPGYVFMDIQYNAETFREVNTILGVRCLPENPMPLSETETEMIKWLSNGGAIIEPSTVTLDDGKITCDGFLAGHEEKITYLNIRQKKARIEVQFGGKVHRANLSLEEISELGK